LQFEPKFLLLRNHAATCKLYRTILQQGLDDEIEDMLDDFLCILHSDFDTVNSKAIFLILGVVFDYTD
jgi:hypothetical protein